MQLTDVQNQVVTQWVKDGASLSEVQKRLQSEFEVSMRFLDVRFLILELGLTLKESKTDLRPASGSLKDESQDDMSPDSEEAISGVQVDVDRVVKPGAVVSGRVRFSDGVNAAWSLDQFGRMAIDAGDRKGYRPSARDVQEFQKQLRLTLEKQGF